MAKYGRLLVLGIITSLTSIVNANGTETENYWIEEVRVWGESLSSDKAGYTSPTSVLSPRDMISINAATTEDLVKFEPGLIVRRRFIGDANGTLGLRTSNMFQTSRSMVFADGVPLHYFLQSRWNGAPRWTMVSASEIEKVEVLYGPFSAEYSGNAMGGVVLIETGIPQEQEFHVNISSFTQQFDDYGFDDKLNGYKAFASYGNKVGDLSYYLSFNHLDNVSQPQTFRGAGVSDTVEETSVSGGILGFDARLRNGEPRELMFYGDTGTVKTITDNYKFKLGYGTTRWKVLLNLAFEDRESETRSANSYIRNTNGQTLWQGTNLVQDGRAFSFNSQRLNESILERESLSVGLRLRGELSRQSNIAVNINQFAILTDEKSSSRRNPDDPDYTSDGEITDIDNSGWQTAEIKLTLDNFTIEGLQFISGLRHENYELNLDVYNSTDYLSGQKENFSSRFGGKTAINAAFAQANWKITEKLDVSLGVRYEQFDSRDGYYSDDIDATPELDRVFIPKRENEKTSPKFSLGYQPRDSLLLRYSIAKAHRFPIVEELFRQYQAFNVVNESTPELRPENGLHHNLMIEKPLNNGYIRVNVFQETVKDAIESQSTTIIGGPNDGVSISTFVPLDETQAKGAEFIANQHDMFVPGLDVRFNLTYTRATIEKNAANAAWEGNTYPRMPKWRSHLLVTYHLSDQLTLGGSMQYASDSFGRIQNDDRIDNVYGAQDAYTRIGVKTAYQFDEAFTTSIGIDNLTNEIAYVAHPWPGRTFYLNFAYDF